MRRLTLRDLQFRSLRFTVVVVATTVVFALLFLMSGLANRFHLEPVHATRAIGADAWVVPVGVSGPFTTATTIDARVARSVRGVDRADPLVTARASFALGAEHREVMLIGHMTKGIGTPPVVRGRAATSRGQVVVDESTGAKVGDTVSIGAKRFSVTGLTRDATVLAGMPFVFMNITDARNVVYPGRALASVIAVRGGTPRVPAGYVVLSNATVAEDTRRPLRQAVRSVETIRMLLWAVSALIIGGLVYLSAMERSRDFAVLKAVGASTRALLASVAAQAIVIASAAVALATALQAVIAPSFPMKVEVARSTFVTLPMLAIGVALLAGAFGMRRVAGTDPAMAFSGPGA